MARKAGLKTSAIKVLTQDALVQDDSTLGEGVDLRGRLGKQLVALEHIVVDPMLQPREGLNAATVADYSERMEVVEGQPVKDPEGREWEALVLFFDADSPQEGAPSYVLADGFHREQAARLKSLKTFQAEVFPGTRRDALKYALSANARHGLQRTNADKRRAVELALGDKDWAAMSARAIAELCLVSVPLVSRVRAELMERGELEASDIIVGRDGKLYPAIVEQPEVKPQGGDAPHVEAVASQAAPAELGGQDAADEGSAALPEEQDDQRQAGSKDYVSARTPGEAVNIDVDQAPAPTPSKPSPSLHQAAARVEAVEREADAFDDEAGDWDDDEAFEQDDEPVLPMKTTPVEQPSASSAPKGVAKPKPAAEREQVAPARAPAMLHDALREDDEDELVREPTYYDIEVGQDVRALLMTLVSKDASISVVEHEGKLAFKLEYW